jgi:hypothetical protein
MMLVFAAIFIKYYPEKVALFYTQDPATVELLNQALVSMAPAVSLMGYILAL